MDFSISDNRIIKLCLWLWLQGKILWNYISRPKISIVFKQEIVVYKDESDVGHHINYPVIIISSPKPLNIDPQNFFINNTKYQQVVSGDKNFEKLDGRRQKKYKSCMNNIVNFYLDKGSIDRGDKLIEIEAHKKYIFPTPFRADVLGEIKKDSLVLFPKTKITITLKIDSKVREYAINRFDAMRIYLNYITFNWDQVFDWETHCKKSK